MTGLVQKRVPVIFDTCTKPAYYTDVHRLLALPEGGVIRYDYSSNHITSEMRSAFDQSISFDTVLIAYAQARDYVKGQPAPHGIQKWEEMMWIGTRFARLLAVWSEQRDQDRRYFLALEMQGYPVRQEELAGSIFRPLHAQEEVPYKIWVAQSPMTEAGVFSAGDDLTQGWTTVINCIGDPPSQFAGDSFWRVKTVRVSNRETHPTPVRSNNRMTNYRLPELASLELDFEVHSPIDRPRSLLVKAPESGPLDDLNGSRQEIERYRPITVRGRTNASNLLRSRDALVGLRTEPKTNEYPEGSEAELIFTVRKSGWRILSAGFLAAVSITAGIFAAQDSLGIELKILSALLVALTAVLTALVWTGKVGLPPLRG